MAASSSKNKKVIVIIALIVVLIIAGVASGWYLKRDNDYNHAVELLEKEMPNEAAAIFKNLNDYKDSQIHLTECSKMIAYFSGISAFEAGDYHHALLLLNELENYRDSRQYITLSEYAITYNDALQKMNNEAYVLAWEILDVLKEKLDSSETDFSTVLDYEELMSAMDECYQYVCYETGLKHYENGNFYDAYTWFKKAGGVLDAQELLPTCIQPFETKELYFDNLFFLYNLELKLKVDKEHTSNVCIKIYAKDTLVTVVAIQPGHYQTVQLPSGYYSFKKGEGENWFGEKDYFGEDGTYSIFIFDEDVRGDVEEEYELHLQSGYSHTIDIDDGEGGNITKQEISYEDFKK